MNYGCAKGLETRVFHKSFEQGAEYHLNDFLGANPNILIVDIQFKLDAEGSGQILLVFRKDSGFDIHFPITYRDIENAPPPPPPSCLSPARTV